jgi:hypothetical protein
VCVCVCYVNLGEGGAADTGTAVEPTRGLVHYERCPNFIHPGQPVFIHDTLVVKLLCLIEESYACVESFMP